MLLVDVPHLASVAERQGALDWIEDPRLAPIAHAVIDGARRGDDLTMPDLLALVEPAAQPQVHDAVFAGRFRDLGERDPQTLLVELLRSCEREKLIRLKRAAEADVRRLSSQGFDREAAERQNYSLQLARRIDELRRPYDPPAH